MTQLTIVIIALLAFLAVMFALAVWSQQRTRRMHVHRWEPIGAKTRQSLLGMASPAQTVVLWRCKDDPMTDTTILDERWTLAEIQGRPAPVLEAVSPAAATGEPE